MKNKLPPVINHLPMRVCPALVPNLDNFLYYRCAYLVRPSHVGLGQVVPLLVFMPNFVGLISVTGQVP